MPYCIRLHLSGKHDAKPSHEELKNWLHSGQVDGCNKNELVNKNTIHILLGH
jgi:hypothetical protein